MPADGEMLHEVLGMKIFMFFSLKYIATDYRDGIIGSAENA
jgi:hypothetical protein